MEIGKVCKTGAGGTPLKSRREFYEGGEIPWLLSGEVCRRDITSAKHFITELGLERSSAKVFPKNTVLIAMYGATAGQVGILRFNSATNQAVCGIYPNEKFLPEYLYYSLLYRQKDLVARATGNAQPNISQIKIKTTQVQFAPISTQKRIVSILDEAFTGIEMAIANTEKNLANAREVFEAARDSTFMFAPDSWEKRNLNELCSIKHGFAFKSEYFATKGKYVILTPGSFWERGGFRDQGKKTKFYSGEIPSGFILSRGDFLIAMTEQAVGVLGSSLIVPEPDRYLHNQRLGLVEVLDGIQWENDFFFHQFNTRAFRASVQSTASGVKVRHTSPAKLGAIAVRFPATQSKQAEIAGRLNELEAESDRLLAIYIEKQSALNELKQSLLHKAFAGELTTDKLEREAEQVAA